MKTIFADSQYWIAIINPKDQWSAVALSVSRALSPMRLLTTDEVLIETLNYFAEQGAHLRRAAASNVREILLNQNIEVVSSGRDHLLEGLAFYQARLDKGYSLTDCISMNVMRERGSANALTHDQHFAQEGFNILL